MNTLRSVIATAGVLFAVGGHAASVSYVLDSSNRLPNGTGYLEVTISDGAEGAIDFVVRALQPLNDVADDKFGIQRFAFNVCCDSTARAGDIIGLPDKWKAKNDKPLSGFGFFDILLRGTGATRTDELHFSIVGVDGDTPMDYVARSTGNARHGNSAFAGRVADFDFIDGGPGRVRSAIVAAVSPAAVPLPGAAWLLMSGVGFAAWFRRSRRRRLAGAFATG